MTTDRVSGVCLDHTGWNLCFDAREDYNKPVTGNRRCERPKKNLADSSCYRRHNAA